MSGKRIYLTDKEVSSVLEITPNTLYRLMRRFKRGGEGRATTAAKTIDINEAKPESFGGYRRWKVENLAKVLGLTKEELLDRIS